jgi:hypothetical protein
MDDNNISITITQNTERIDISKWKEFVIGKNKDRDGLFVIEKPLARVQTKYFAGNVPFVASGNYNNGIQNYVEPEADETLDKGGCITVSPVDGSAFYQETDFLGRGGAGSSIFILRNEKLNRYNAQFICTAIRIMFSKYVYNNMGTATKFKDDLIRLPANKNGEPDWCYMEQFMREAEEVKGFF